MSDIIKVPSVNNEVYDRLKQRITLGVIPPGKKISIRTIAELFGVSTMPVREALRMLQAEGFITFERRSVTVNELSVEEVKQMFTIRKHLEMLAAEWSLEHITDTDLGVLEDILESMANPNMDVTEWRKLNKLFHLRFYECSKSSHVLELIKNVWDKVEPYMTIYSSSVDDFQEAHIQHREILDLIQQRNLPLLLEKIADHLIYTCDVVLKALSNKK
ncbi:GntR family transcriptional regulator [Paenibacillus sp. CGMCC 1.16610]|uniref:FCD domain-containing protein n=1 Tax=Paenibacillus anseongense TaxID=2682845 RepID=A0ABW9U3V8_9BACL|nr:MULTISPECIES: GntR family transcriptional regulator [Paenibacillus]MBA2938817.1 GntR family transcriptional regulator [Paenibacillus sp. CGMCC 1.16610]MVQ34779.1 FCD domain-containing protein [Paenibacillus anseongense]